MAAKEFISFLLLLNFTSCFALYPVILVPGDGGNQMEAKLNKPAVVHYICSKKTADYFNIWLNLQELAPVLIDCWIDNVRLSYNATTRRTSNSPGVDIRIPGFGNSSVVEYLDPSKASSGLYFHAIVEGSLLPLGYTRDVNVRGAPYDFRKAPNEMRRWLENFKGLIEETYETNGRMGVILLGHSMGAPLSLYFLQRATQEWKDKYIRALVTLGGPWGGSVKALKAFASGDDLNAYLLPSLKMRTSERTYPSTAWLLPSKLFWKEDEVLVSIDGFENKNYTRGNLQKFFKDINTPNGYEMFKDTENLLGNFEPPGVPLYCLHGTGVSSVESLRYKNTKSFPDKPTLVNGNGDGTVNIRSLRGCLRWQDSNLNGRNGAGVKNSNQIFHQEFPGIDHMDILRSPEIVIYLKGLFDELNTN